MHVLKTIKGVLSDQFLANANDESWYLPFTKSVEKITEDEAFWRPTDNSHSIAEIVQHLIYWNKTWQVRYRESNVGAVHSMKDNDKTFEVPENKKFHELKDELLDVLLKWKDLLSEDQLGRDVEGFPFPAKWYDVLGNAISHNAYHIGQIVYIEKLQLQSS